MPYPGKKSQAKERSLSLKARLFLLYSFPVVLFCSYYPLIPIASTSSTNYELSLPMIWLFIFSVLSLKDFALAVHNAYKKKHWLHLLPILFPLYLSFTIIWSANPFRAILAMGILWCIIITSTAIITKLKKQASFDKAKFIRIFLLSSLGFCIICWVQSILDCLGVDRSITLLCPGCTSYSFGFPHPSGLAIEPQFMGNLLLAPTFVALYLWTRPTATRPDYFNRRTLLGLSFFFSSTLFLTFSRGAIYSFAFTFIILFITTIAKLHNKKFWQTVPLLFLSFLFTLFIQGVFSSISYTNSTFASGIERSISQLSLGKINPHLSTDEELTSSLPETTDTTTPVFDGYVEESTDVRIGLNRIALDLATKSPAKFTFGYGISSAGIIMHQAGRIDTPSEIVQNEYVSLLLETGLVGLITAVLAVVIILLELRRIAQPERYLIGGVILSFLLTLLFFSGLPNAIHLYLFPIMLVATLPRQKPEHSSSRQ